MVCPDHPGSSRTSRRGADAPLRGLVAGAACGIVLRVTGADVAAVAVWLWAGISPSQVPPEARTLYVYQGVIAEREGQVAFERRGLHPHGGDPRPVVPVVRFSGRPSADSVAQVLTSLAAAWEARGRHVPMLQIDRDAASGKIAEHARFVEAVRERLDRRYALSVTALADWLVATPRPDLLRLSRAADEIVFQLYHRRHAVPLPGRYDAALAGFEAPFKVGLLRDMPLPRRASQSANWRGSVIFLLRERE